MIQHGKSRIFKLWLLHEVLDRGSIDVRVPDNLSVAATTAEIYEAFAYYGYTQDFIEVTCTEHPRKLNIKLKGNHEAIRSNLATPTPE